MGSAIKQNEKGKKRMKLSLWNSIELYSRVNQGVMVQTSVK